MVTIMDEKELRAIVSDIQASPTECEWVEIKHDNEDPETIGDMFLHWQIVRHIWASPGVIWCGV